MISQVVADVHLFDLAVLVLHLQKYVLEKVIVVLLSLDVRDAVRQFRRGGRVLRVAVAILQDDRLGEGGLVVETGTRGPMTAGAYFKVKRTVYFVLFRAENRRQVFRHFFF